MSIVKRSTLQTGLLAATVLCLSTTAFAEVIEIPGSNYFVRPGLRTNTTVTPGGSFGPFIDGYVANGPTTSSQFQGVTGYSESTVSLDDGTVKMYIEEYGEAEGLQAFGSMGDQLTFVGGGGTNYNTSFALDGTFDYHSDGLVNDVTPTPVLFYDVGIAIYEAGVTDYDHFAGDQAMALAYSYSQEIIELDVAEAGDYSINIFESVSASLLLASDYEVLDIFVFTNLAVYTDYGSGLEYYVGDALNTATFGQTVVPGVNVTSTSGTFLPTLRAPDPTNVPEPSTLALLGFGLAFAGWRLGQRRRYSCIA